MAGEARAGCVALLPRQCHVWGKVPLLWHQIGLFVGIEEDELRESLD